jgi:hypothetical protein
VTQSETEVKTLSLGKGDETEKKKKRFFFFAPNHLPSNLREKEIVAE